MFTERALVCELPGAVVFQSLAEGQIIQKSALTSSGPVREEFPAVASVMRRSNRARCSG
jgi:hypothetical protein